ncbi:type II CRISPR RNA-guided endonuclease Cas9, partial [Flavobacterium filum]|uniref:type II CRISPR RNA-guided endonuclease Cas9 n=1 Tax=Flavobacterium filum TaxID=370974 RepID=UPI0023F0B9A8
PKSNPYYQEFRIWQWLNYLKIYQKEDDKEVTSEFISGIEDFEKLFDFLNSRKDVEQKALVEYLVTLRELKNATPLPTSASKKAIQEAEKELNKKIKSETEKFRWNYVEDKSYPCNETGSQIRKRLSKVEDVPTDFLTAEIEKQLWHIIYSVNDRNEFEKALRTFANKHKLDESSFVENFRKIPPFKSEYGAFSEKAIKKLLPLMRIGKYWNWEAIDSKTKNRIDKILTGEYDEEIKNLVRKKAIHLTEQKHFQGIELWLAQYVVYDRHSEVSDSIQWKTLADIEEYLKEFKQHSLRNPIVEQVVTETLRVVKDIWQNYGKVVENFFNEIHIELGRDMKNTAEDRKRITNKVTDNENTNMRIKLLLAELKNDNNIEGVREYSPSQQEILKIYEEYALSNEEKYDERTKSFVYEIIPEDIIKISKNSQPTKAELIRYKLWLEQKYRSPYTGEIIPLSKLFTEAYQIEHIIPQSRYFDDSFSNKVICEAAVNQLKNNQLGFEFIKKHHGEKLQDKNKTIEIFSVEAYEIFVKEHYAKNHSKRTKLLLEEIPDKMIERQLNDTRYISKFISSILSNIVRGETNDEGINSKNVLHVNGKITSELRQDWGLNDVWNNLILPRFERMNLLTQTTHFTTTNKEGHTIPNIPLELSKGFQKKRIDHRHHALDALVIACATRDHVNLLNNQYAKSENSRYDLQNKLRNKEKWTSKDGKELDKFTEFKKPWEDFTIDAKNRLEKIVVSFKQNLRVLNKATNFYEKIENGIRRKVEQKGTNWAIRKSLHTPMPYGKKVYEFNILKIADNVSKREFILDNDVKIKVEEAYQNNKCKITETQKYLKKNPIKDNNGNEIIVTAFRVKTEKFRKRQPLSVLSNRGQGGIKTVEDAVKFIGKIADFKIQHDLLIHLNENDNDIEKSYSAEGLERFNAKRKIPVYKLPIAESGSGRFSVGTKIGTRHKWVEADKGTNLFFAIYEDNAGKRDYETIPLNVVIERQKQGLSSVPVRNEKGNNLCSLCPFLSPNELVYVPTEDEKVNLSILDFNNLSEAQKKRIYKMVSSSGKQCFFLKQEVATTIVNKTEYSALNKMEKSIDDIMIKEVCIKLKVDRLGNISKA